MPAGKSKCCLMMMLTINDDNDGGGDDDDDDDDVDNDTYSIRLSQTPAAFDRFIAK